MNLATARRLLLSSLLIATIALFAAACGDDSTSGGGSSDGGSGGADCGTTKDGALDIVRHCGDASGEITVGGQSVKFDDGQCQNTADSIVVNLGVTVLASDPTKADYSKHSYMGVLAGKHPAAAPDAPAADKDGKYTNGVFISGVANGKPVALTTSELELKDGRESGSFTGTGSEGEKVSGTFSCG